VIYNTTLYDHLLRNFNIIFSQNISTDEAQSDIIKIAKEYLYLSQDFKIYIIEKTEKNSYAFKKKIQKENLQSHIMLPFNLSSEDFYAYYKSADIFLGMPLKESVLLSTPVITYCEPNKGGIFFTKKDYLSIASAIQLIRENPKLRYEILQTQQKTLNNFQKGKNKIRYQFEGPFDSSYSLAILNRNSAKTFDDYFDGKVSLYSLEGGGDFEPSQTFLNTHKQIKKLFDKSEKAINAEVTFRNCYPPKVRGMKSQINILNSYGWEESGFPKDDVQYFNENLNGIIAVSNYVKQTLINNGVKTPIKVINNPVDNILHVEPKPYQLKSSKNFRFLHISSCFPRKGIDVLLEAYTEAYTGDDDVTLLIKTFPNPHNTIEEQIQQIQKKLKNPPEIELINKDLEEAYIVWLYQNSNALVAPSRGEGFGLPMAEAMLFDLPVITTSHGGQTDFCTTKTSWLIDYTFKKSETHLNLFNSYWAEPSKDSLLYQLKKQTSLSNNQKREKTDRAKEFVLKEFRWKNYLKQTLSFIEELKRQELFDTKVKNLAWISTFNTKCGIAAYSEFLLQHFHRYSLKIYANYSKTIISQQKESKVVRCWKDRFDSSNEELIQEVLANKTTHVVINFNFAFFSMTNLETILKTFHKHNIKTTIIFHSVEDVTIKGLEASLSCISQTLKKVNSLLVHNIKELNLLKSFGLVANVHLFAHGTQNTICKSRYTKEK